MEPLVDLTRRLVVDRLGTGDDFGAMTDSALHAPPMGSAIEILFGTHSLNTTLVSH